jgi:hypothetical protein
MDLLKLQMVHDVNHVIGTGKSMHNVYIHTKVGPNKADTRPNSVAG